MKEGKMPTLVAAVLTAALDNNRLSADVRAEIKTALATKKYRYQGLPDGVRSLIRKAVIKEMMSPTMLASDNSIAIRYGMKAPLLSKWRKEQQMGVKSFGKRGRPKGAISLYKTVKMPDGTTHRKKLTATELKAKQNR